MFFVDKDYETFNEEYTKLNTKEIRGRRKEVQEKLLEINSDVKKFILDKYNLHNHWKNANITSLLFPCEYNHGIVNWLGVRYGRSKRDIMLLNSGRELTDEYWGFQKYNCFQLDISRTGIDIGIYHSVPNDSIDRAYVREQLNKNNINFINNLSSEIEKLQGYDYKFEVSCLNKEIDKWENKTFSFDNFKKENVGQEFIKFYRENCIDRTYSSILYHYPRKDNRIKDKESIEKELLMHIDLLYPLYKVISWNFNNN